MGYYQKFISCRFRLVMFGTKCVDLKLWSGQFDCWTLHSNTKNICYNTWWLCMVYNTAMTSNIIDINFISISVFWRNGPVAGSRISTGIGLGTWARALARPAPFPAESELMQILLSHLEFHLEVSGRSKSGVGSSSLGVAATTCNKEVSCYPQLTIV